MSAINQPIIWLIEKECGGYTREFDEDGTETNYSTIKDQFEDFKFIGLYDLVNSRMYAIDLNDGAVLIGGIKVYPSVNIDGRDHRAPAGNFKGGVTQYKCSKPVSITSIGSGQVQAQTFNIGYTIEFPPFTSESYTSLEVTLTIDAESMTPSVSIKFS
jgi:hypothetical protein